MSDQPRVRIGTGGSGFSGPDLVQLAEDLDDLGFDSIWLPELLTGPGIDPLVGLAWIGASLPQVKLGTTMVLPGRNLVRLAGQLAALDHLSEGRLLLTFVPGLAHGVERAAIGVPPAARGAWMDEAFPMLRRLWEGGPVSYDGLAGSFEEVTISPLPVSAPLEAWFGGLAPAALERCGRLADGWLPSMCTPDEAARGREVVDEAAAAAGRSISPEHFGVSIGYSHHPLDDRVRQALEARARGSVVDELVPVGSAALRDLIEGFVAVGFSKFVVRPLVAPAAAGWRSELEGLAEAIGDLQT